MVCSFLTEVGKLHGASQKECMQLSLLGEEVLLFILKGIPKYEFDEQFTLTCTIEEDGLLLSFSNHGEPLYNRNMEEYSPYSPEENIDNLGLEIIKGISDWCEYVNRGRDGWSVIVSKHLESFKEISRYNSEELERLTKDASCERLSIVRAEGKHAAGIIALMYKTYRYSYVKSIFYYEDKLRDALDSGKIVSLIAINSKGEVVGNTSALFDSELLAEVGMFMVDPIYRKNITLLILIKQGKKLFLGKEFEATTFYNKCITTHIISQRSAKMTGFIPTALKLSVYPRASFIGIGGGDKKRESLIYSVIPHSSSIETIYLPREHREMADRIFSTMKIECSYGEMSCQREECEDAVVNSAPKSGYFTIEIKGVGEDLGSRLSQLTGRAMRDGAVTIACEISAMEPLPSDFEEIMRDHGMIFCGFTPSSEGGWRLLYISLQYQTFDFNDVNLFDPLALELKSYIEDSYHKLEI